MDERFDPYGRPAADRDPLRSADLTALWLAAVYLGIGIAVPAAGAVVPGPVVSAINTAAALVAGLARYALEPRGPRRVPVYTGVVAGMTTHYALVVGLVDDRAGLVPLALVVLGLGGVAVARLAGSPSLWDTARRVALVLTGVAAVAVPSLWSWRILVDDGSGAGDPFLVRLFGATVAAGVLALAVLLVLRTGRGPDRLFGGVLAATAVALGGQIVWRLLLAVRGFDLDAYLSAPLRFVFLGGTVALLVLLVAYLARLATAHRVGRPAVSPAPAR